MRWRLVLSLLSLTAICGVALAHGAASGGVPRPIQRKLTRGVNVTRWFCYLNDPKDTAHFRDYMKPADFAAFKALKLGFIRLCVSPEAIYREGEPDEANLPYIDAAVDRLEANGLLTVWDLHDNGQMKMADGKSDQGFLTFWQAIARHYKGKHENTVVFELLNEPTYEQNPQDWYRLQRQTVEAIRAVDPRRTILVTGNQWGGIDALAAMTPLPQKNLIYSYHCYDPFLFTHQGASWVGDVPKLLKRLPFPSSPEKVEQVLDANPPQFRQTIVDYGNSRFGWATLQGRIGKAVEWGSRHGVPTLLGEFGAYPLESPPDSRSSWFEAMRSVTDRLRAPNCLWGYDDVFGLGRRIQPDGKLWLDPIPLAAFYGYR